MLVSRFEIFLPKQCMHLLFGVPCAAHLSEVGMESQLASETVV